MTRYLPINAQSITNTEGLADWRYLNGSLHAVFRLGSFSAAASFTAEVALIADEMDHHPEIDLRFPDRVHIATFTHYTGDTTMVDVDLARSVSDLARRCGATAEPLTSQVVELAIDTTDADRIRPFWRAVLDYRDFHGALVDPRRVGPPLWFQHTDEPRTERNRFHLDITVAHDEAERRIAAALGAGGRMANASHARKWWVLADADGNEACICTWQDR